MEKVFIFPHFVRQIVAHMNVLHQIIFMHRLVVHFMLLFNVSFRCSHENFQRINDSIDCESTSVRFVSHTIQLDGHLRLHHF